MREFLSAGFDRNPRVETRDTLGLLQPVVHAGDSTWLDIGAGMGTFTETLASLLGESGLVYAFDRDPAAVRSLLDLSSDVARRSGHARIVAAVADLSALPVLPPLDGVLLANVLHFIAEPEQGVALTTMVRLLAPSGRLLVIEYENRPANRWVPHPVSRERLMQLAAGSSLSEPTVVAVRPSAYGGSLYAAVLRPK